MTPTALYLVGPPGVGKSTVVEALLAGYEVGGYVRPDGYGTFGYEPLLTDGKPVGVYLGRHRDTFSGTDALAMGVMPHAVRWAEEAPLPGLVVGEGARLAAPKFWLPLHRRARLVLVHLTAAPEVLAVRRAGRGNVQDVGWMKGAETRAGNAVHRAAALGMQVWRLDTSGVSVGRVAEWVSALLAPVDNR